MKPTIRAGRAPMLAAIGWCVLCGSPAAHAADAAQALQEYTETVRQADALVASGDPFEAVRLYERAGRIAYNNKLATDGAALNAKLAAARSARDAKSAAAAPAAAPATAAAPAASPAQAANSPPAAAAASKAGGSEDANAWFQYGDGLAAVGEYVDAVRAYERGRRLAINNRVPFDAAALNAKIASATQASKAPPAHGDLIPEPLAPLPSAPGSEPLPPYLRERPGKLRPWVLQAQYSKSEMQVSDSEMKAFEANLRKIMEVLARAPVLNPPVGFELDASVTLDSLEDVKERQRYVAARKPLRGAIRFSGAAYFEEQLRSKATGVVRTAVSTYEEPYCRDEITVNKLPHFFVSGIERIIEGDEEYLFEPRRDGELGGVPVFGDTLVIARPGAVFWLPVSTERALQVLMPRYKKSADGAAAYIESRKQKYAEFMSPASQEKRRREVATERSEHSEANAHKLEVMQHRWEEDARKEAETVANDPKFRGPIDLYRDAQAMFAGLDAAGRAAPACIAAGPPQLLTEEWRVVPAGTAGCRALVRVNPDLVSAKFPRSELQLLLVSRLTMVNEWLEARKFERNQPGDCVAMAHILRQTDWKQLVGLLAH